MATARNSSRVVGVYIDIVQPGFHNAIALTNNGTLQEDLVLNAVNSTRGDRHCYILLSWSDVGVYYSVHPRWFRHVDAALWHLVTALLHGL